MTILGCRHGFVLIPFGNLIGSYLWGCWGGPLNWWGICLRHLRATRWLLWRRWLCNLRCGHGWHVSGCWCNTSSFRALILRWECDVNCRSTGGIFTSLPGNCNHFHRWICHHFRVILPCGCSDFLCGCCLRLQGTRCCRKEDYEVEHPQKILHLKSLLQPKNLRRGEKKYLLSSTFYINT
uniref:Uncharacterized protein n=1 Tax=Lutzomyia longipalpis TaxID=7200 RepID=A0A7G3B153_LUTLO